MTNSHEHLKQKTRAETVSATTCLYMYVYVYVYVYIYICLCTWKLVQSKHTIERLLMASSYFIAPHTPPGQLFVCNIPTWLGRGCGFILSTSQLLAWGRCPDRSFLIDAQSASADSWHVVPCLRSRVMPVSLFDATLRFPELWASNSCHMSQSE